MRPSARSVARDWKSASGREDRVAVERDSRHRLAERYEAEADA